VTHPNQLHALAALWSLRAARRVLDQVAADEARQIMLEVLQAADGLRSPLYSGGRGTGGHGDPVAGAALGSTGPVRANRYAQLAERTTGTLTWLAGQLAGDLGRGHPDPAALLTQLVSSLQPVTAANLDRWAGDLDQRIRTALALHPDQWPLLGNPDCPACHVRQLYAQTSAPITREWTVICRAGCICTGPGCTCGMPMLAAGVRHVWGRTSALVEQHLARLEA
jgi:hypothetical protein